MSKLILILVIVLAGYCVSGQTLLSRQAAETTHGLVAYFPFNGDANDLSGNGNHGSLVNGALFTNDRNNKTNGAIQFDKSLSQYVNVPNNALLQIGDSVSFSFWAKRNTLGGQDQVLNKGGDWPNGTCNYGLVFSDWTLVFIYNGGYYYVGEPGVPQDNNWHFYAVTAINGTTEVRFYVDGIEKASLFGQLGNPVVNLFAESTSDLYISGVNYFSNNSMDELKIYNKILTANEISSLYWNQVAFYPFNGNANDESGNGHNGTITGALVTPAADRYGEEGKAFKFWFPDYVSVPANSAFFTDEFTVSYWYKVSSYWGDRGVLSCVGNKGGYQQVFSAGTTFTYLLGYNFPINSWFWANYTVPNTPNTWQHVITTYKKTGDNTSAARLYINTELKSSENYSNSIAYPGSDVLYIGRNHSDLGLNGELDNVRFFDKVLNDDEIIALYLVETKPLLQQPANKSSVNTLTPEMQWISPMANGEFIFQLAADTLFGTILHEQQSTVVTAQLPGSLLSAGKTFYWRVCSKLNGVTGPWSPVWSFSSVNTGIADPHSNQAKLLITPNPANHSGKITYCIPSSDAGIVTVSIEVINSAGKLVQKLANKKRYPGTYDLELNTTMFQAGVYHVRLITENTATTTKLVIVH